MVWDGSDAGETLTTIKHVLLQRLCLLTIHLDTKKQVLDLNTSIGFEHFKTDT